MNDTAQPNHIERIKDAVYVWFTTVRDDGMPQPTPVWFIWQDDHFLIFSNPRAQKVRNIRSNPKVAISYTAVADAEEFSVIMGEAVTEDNATPPTQVPAYLEKYSQSIIEIGMTHESFDQTYSTAIRVTPVRTRGLS